MLGNAYNNHRHYIEVLKSDEERIMACIRGFEAAVSNDIPLLSVSELFAGFVPWLDDASTLVVRFEDLIGSRGGGDIENQLASIRHMGEFIGRPLSHGQAERIAGKMYREVLCAEMDRRVTGEITLPRLTGVSSKKPQGTC